MPSEELGDEVYRSQHSDRYHTEKSCHELQKAQKHVRTMRKEVADAWGLRVCRHCDGSWHERNKQAARGPYNE